MALYNKEAPAMYTKHEHLRRQAAARGHFCAVARGPATQHYMQLLEQVMVTNKQKSLARDAKMLGRPQNAWTPPPCFYVSYSCA
jgi:hypothetical protein